MKIRLELLNLITGVLLVISGVINIFKGQFEIAIGWIIFGSMYLVMDNYKIDLIETTRLHKATRYTRQIFGWVGLIGSILLLFLSYLF